MGVLARLDGRSRAVLGLSLLAAILMFATEALPLWEVEVADFSCAVLATAPGQADQCVTYGIEQHRMGIALVGLWVAGMGAGASIGSSRPAAIALCAAAVLVLVIALAVDLPASRSTGEIGRDFAQASAEGRSGLWAEIAAGALALAAGVLALRRKRRSG